MTCKSSIRTLRWVLLLCVLGSAAASAQTDPAASSASAQSVPEIPEDALGRGTPRGAVLGYLNAVQEQDYKTAADYLDLRNLSRKNLFAEDGPRLAEQLDLVLVRKLWIDIPTLSNDPGGMVGDGLPTFRDRMGVINTSTGEVELLLQRVPRGDGEFIWKLSNVTVALIPGLYEEFSYPPWVEAISDRIPDVSFFGVELFKWVIGLTAAVLVYFLLFFLAKVALKQWVRKDWPLRDSTWRLIRGPLLLLIASTTAGYTMVLKLGVGVAAQEIVRARTLTTIFTAWLLVSLASLLRDGYSARLIRLNRQSAVVLLRPLTTALKSVLVVFAVLFWLDNAGFNITTLLAGLGVGGIAVALVLQKPLEDIFGAITIYTQQPIRVGDFCRFGDKAGIVEDIGLRATRLRTLDRTVVTLPNAKLAGEYIDNYSLRNKFRYRPDIRLRYDTSPDQIRYILVEIRKLLYSHPKVISKDARVRFMGFGPHSFDIRPNVYVATTDFAEYLKIAEDLNLRMIDIIKQAGTYFALPSQTMFTEQGPGVDRAQAQKTEKLVQSWREKGELSLPDSPEDEIRALESTLSYPPAGSPTISKRAGEKGPRDGDDDYDAGDK